MSLFAAYADFSGGLLFLCVLAILVPALAVWTFYWTAYGFRGRLPRGQSFSWWLIRCVPILALVVCFPASRLSANWRDPTTQQSIPPSLADEYDRFLFGYLPHTTWIGDLGHEDICRCSVELVGQGRYDCSLSHRVVDWLWFFPQLGILTLILLPVFRSETPTNQKLIS